jgi:tight adherence protein B
MAESILLFVSAAVVAGLVVAVFVLARGLITRSADYWARRLPEDKEAGIVLVEDLPQDGKPSGWPARLDRSFEELVRRAGIGLTRQQALGWMALTGVLFAGALFLWQWELGFIGPGLVLGMSLPLIYYLFMHARWRRQIQNQLPDVLFLMARSLRAGLSLEQALENVAQSGPSPVAEEFRRGVERIRLGLTIPAALQGVAKRLNLPDFDVFVTVVTLHRNLGGNLTLLLDRVATTTRDRNLFRGHFRTATALSRITTTCLALGAPLIFLGYALWQPDFVSRFLASSGGIRLLATAASLEVIGVIWVGILLRMRY